MQKLLSIMTSNALNDFLGIINAYGAFLREKELVKKINKDESLSVKMCELIEPYRDDPYSWASREFGVVTGITKDQKEDFKNSVESIFNSKDNILVKSLISSEKYYKKLKHKFVADYPQFEKQMKEALTEHQQYNQSKKCEQYHAKNSIIGLSNRFIAFFHYSFDCGEGVHISYSTFARHIINKYKIVIERKMFDKVCFLLDFEYKKDKKVTLTLLEVDFIVKILKSFVENVSKEDLETANQHICPTNSGNHSREEKGEIASKIINENFTRFKKLYFEYETLKNKL